MHIFKRLALVFAINCFTWQFAQAFTDTAPLNVAVDSDQVSVSGVSSGGYMAVQLHIAYSDLFMGVGAVAGGPYFCAENRRPDEIDTVKKICMVGIGTDLTAQTYIDEARRVAQLGLISNLDNLRDDKIYIFNSQADQVINPTLGFITKLFYNEFVDSASEQIAAWSFIPKFGPFYPVAHGMPSDNEIFTQYQGFDNYVTPCAPSNSQQSPWFPNQFFRGNDPWIYYCDAFFTRPYNLAEDILSHIYGDLQDPEPIDLNRMYSFDQLTYIGDPTITTVEKLQAAGLDDKGYVYVPDACADGSKQCRLHVALHGCQMFPKWSFKGKVGSAVEGQTITYGGLYRENVYNTVAEANDIIVVYPQAHNIGTLEQDTNPYGCWEFWPFENSSITTYYTREGRETKFIANVVQALVAGTLEVHSKVLAQ